MHSPPYACHWHCHNLVPFLVWKSRSHGLIAEAKCAWVSQKCKSLYRCLLRERCVLQSHEVKEIKTSQHINSPWRRIPLEPVNSQLWSECPVTLFQWQDGTTPPPRWQINEASCRDINCTADIRYWPRSGGARAALVFLRAMTLIGCLSVNYSSLWRLRWQGRSCLLVRREEIRSIICERFLKLWQSKTELQNNLVSRASSQPRSISISCFILSCLFHISWAEIVLFTKLLFHSVAQIRTRAQINPCTLCEQRWEHKARTEVILI